MDKRKLTDAEIEAAAASDPDNPPLSAERLVRMRRVPFAKLTRRKLGLSQEEFDELQRVINNPPPPNDALVDLMSRKPAWDTTPRKKPPRK